MLSHRDGRASNRVFSASLFSPQSRGRKEIFDVYFPVEAGGSSQAGTSNQRN